MAQSAGERQVSLVPELQNMVPCRVAVEHDQGVVIAGSGAYVPIPARVQLVEPDDE